MQMARFRHNDGHDGVYAPCGTYDNDALAVAHMCIVAAVLEKAMLADDPDMSSLVAYTAIINNIAGIPVIDECVEQYILNEPGRTIGKRVLLRCSLAVLVRNQDILYIHHVKDPRIAFS